MLGFRLKRLLPKEKKKKKLIGGVLKSSGREDSDLVRGAINLSNPSYKFFLPILLFYFNFFIDLKLLFIILNLSHS